MSHIMKMQLPEVPNFGFDKERDTLITSFQGDWNETYVIVGINDPCFTDNPGLDNLFILSETDDSLVYSGDGLESIKRMVEETVGLIETEKENILNKVMRYLESREIKTTH